MALGMTLKLYTSVAKELKLKVKKFFWGVVPTFVEGTRKKLVKCPPLPPPHSNPENPQKNTFTRVSF